MIQITYDLGELLLGLFVQVAHGNTGSKNGIVGMGDGHVSGSFSCLFVYSIFLSAQFRNKHILRPLSTNQVIQLNSSNPLVHPRNNLLSDGCSIYMLAVQPVTKTGNTGSDLIELNTFLAAIYWLSMLDALKYL